MVQRFVRFLAATLRVPLWIPVVIACVWWSILFLAGSMDLPYWAFPNYGAFALAWIVFVVFYFPARIYRHYRDMFQSTVSAALASLATVTMCGAALVVVMASNMNPAWALITWVALVPLCLSVRFYLHRRGCRVKLWESLAIVAGLHAPAVAAFLWAPLTHDTLRSMAAEAIGLDFPIYPAVFLATWGLVCVFLALRYERVGRFDATPLQWACAFAICGILLVFAVGAQTAIPEFLPAFIAREDDSSMPPTGLLLAFYPAWYAVPLIGAATAAAVPLVGTDRARVRKGLFDGLIVLAILSNLGMVFTLTSMYLPMVYMCSYVYDDGTEPPFGKTGVTRLHVAAMTGRVDSVKRLIARGDAVDVRDADGVTPLQYAIEVDQFDAVRTLLALGASANGVAGDGGPLIRAISGSKRHRRPNRYMAEFLLQNGAGVNTGTETGTTPLHAAVRADAVEVAELLLAKGGNVDALSVRGTPLDVAPERQCNPMVEVLLQHGAVSATEEEKEARKRGVQARAGGAGSCS